MDMSEVMRTSFSAREFTDAPVTDDEIVGILEDARFAPSGGNRQGWHVVVIREQTTRDRLVELIVPTMKRYLAQEQAGERGWSATHDTALTPQDIESGPDPSGYVRAVMNAPVLLAVLLDLDVVAAFDQDLDRVGVVPGASVYPFAWNILLSARNHGLSGTLTTFAAATEPDVLDLLEAPSNFAIAALLPLGRPTKQLTKLTRKSPAAFTTLETFRGSSIAE